MFTEFFAAHLSAIVAIVVLLPVLVFSLALFAEGVRRLTITGSTLRAQPPENKARIADGLRRTLWPMFGDGRLKVIVHKVFAFDDVVAAHTMLESGTHFGKLLLKVR